MHTAARSHTQHNITITKTKTYITYLSIFGHNQNTTKLKAVSSLKQTWAISSNILAKNNWNLQSFILMCVPSDFSSYCYVFKLSL